MAKKVQGYVKLQVPAGSANPSPADRPRARSAGRQHHGVLQAVQCADPEAEKGLPIPVVITVYSDRSFTFIMKTPPASVLIRKALGIEKGSGTPNTSKVGKISLKQLEEIAKTKTPDLTPLRISRPPFAPWRALPAAWASTSKASEGALNMTVTAKRIKAWKSKLVPGKAYPIDEALGLVKEFAKAKFSESVDVAVNLGIDAAKSDQQVRGSTVMPHGIGKSVRVAVFTSGKNQEAAKAAGADIVGLEDLAEQVKAGNINFDVVIASPDAMRVVGQLGQILGPRGLMPNPKVGTVSPDVAGAVKNAKSGQVRYRVDKAGIVHCTIGKSAFEPLALRENLQALINDLQRAKPASSKGIYLKRVTLSSTMGPGVIVDHSTLTAS